MADYLNALLPPHPIPSYPPLPYGTLLGAVQAPHFTINYPPTGSTPPAPQLNNPSVPQLLPPPVTQTPGAAQVHPTPPNEGASGTKIVYCEGAICSEVGRKRM